MFAFDVKVIRTAGNLGEAITDHRDEVMKGYEYARIFDTYAEVSRTLPYPNPTLPYAYP